MTDDANRNPLAALLALVLLLVLAVGGAAFYLFNERQQRAVTIARLAEAEAREHRAIAQVMESRAAEMAAAQADPPALVPQPGDATPPAREQADAIRTAVEQVLRTQQQAWNRGDVDAFVDHYWHSPDVTFSASGATTRGWEATANRYRERYLTRERMGQLAFDQLEVTPLSADAALVLGQWRLDRDNEPVSGNFTLVLRRLDGRWVIVHDHTSRAPE